MPPSIPIVIISSDVESTSNISKLIGKLGPHASIEGVAVNFNGGYEVIHKKRPLVVILDICKGDLDPCIDAIHKILDRFPRTSIFAVSEDRTSETILKIMRAGATEYLLKPVSEVDLTSALQKLGRLWITKPEAGVEQGQIYTVFSPKGGVGVTTIALNLATNIHTITNKPTLLVDLDLTAGDVTTFLNLKPTYTISDVTTNMSRLDPSFLKGVIQKHDSGINILAEPQNVEEGVSISAEDIKRVLKILKTMFPYVVLDTEPILNNRTLAAIEIADVILLTFVLTLPGIRNMQRYLNYLEKINVKRDKIKLVVNRFLKKGDIKIEEAEKVLKHPIFLSIPNEYNTAIACLNKGVPISTYDTKSKLNVALKELAITLVAKEK
jgi:pilus assembly protein CpaE